MAVTTNRRFRRRLRVVLALVTVVFVIGFFKFENSTLQRDWGVNESLFNNSEKLHSGFSGSGVLDGRKTVPFLETKAAQESQFNRLMKTTSPLKKMNDQSKIELIKQLHDKKDPHNSRLKVGYKFYESIFSVIRNAKPKVNKLNDYKSNQRIYHARYDSQNYGETIFNEDYLSSFLQLKSEQISGMKESHSYVMENLPDKPPKNFYSGNGIVYVGGGKFNWLTLLSIKSIRATGSTLPVEILIPSVDEYDPDLCARVFPALNAHCIYLPHLLSDDTKDSSASKFKFKGYQYKALAMLLLSFENVLLLDGDNIPLRAPDHLFTNKPFSDSGLVVWPDFWRRATSPLYYQIAGIDIDTKYLHPVFNELTGAFEEVKMDKPQEYSSAYPLHERKGSIPDPTTESGQLMISKSSHTKALLLALYYNVYGPDYYYPLFSQGSDGEGDKETFLAASVATRKSFYQPNSFLYALGHWESDNFHGTGMGQYDPVENYNYNAKKRLLDAKPESERKSMIDGDSLLRDGPRLLFVHSNVPKLNPWQLKVENQLFNDKGERVRLYGTLMRRLVGYDFESVQWSNMKSLLCELNIHLSIFDNVNHIDLCHEINEQLNFLISSVPTLE